MFYCYWWFTIIIIIIIIKIKMIITIIKGGEWMANFRFSSVLTVTSPETCNNKKMQINIRDQDFL